MSSGGEHEQDITGLREEVLHWLDHRLDRFDDVSDKDLEGLVMQLEELSLDQVMQKLYALGFDASAEPELERTEGVGERMWLLAADVGTEAYFEGIAGQENIPSFEMIYSELQKTAEAYLARPSGNADPTLSATDLVHETFLRLVEKEHALWQSRTLYLFLAARVMRHVLVDRARRGRKRGGSKQVISLDETQSLLEEPIPQLQEQADLLVSLDEALRRLEQLNPRQSQIVECCFFGEMTVQETAAALGDKVATVERDWAHAKAWLYRELKKSSER